MLGQADAYILSIAPEKRNRVWETIGIIRIAGQALSISIDHGGRSHGIEIVDVDVRG